MYKILKLFFLMILAVGTVGCSQQPTTQQKEEFISTLEAVAEKVQLERGVVVESASFINLKMPKSCFNDLAYTLELTILHQIYYPEDKESHIDCNDKKDLYKLYPYDLEVKNDNLQFDISECSDVRHEDLTVDTNAYPKGVSFSVYRKVSAVCSFPILNGDTLIGSEFQVNTLQEVSYTGTGE